MYETADRENLLPAAGRIKRIQKLQNQKWYWIDQSFEARAVKIEPSDWINLDGLCGNKKKQYRKVDPRIDPVAVVVEEEEDLWEEENAYKYERAKGT